ncbi:MAG TPA: sensor histidine kinase, partial [Candidatus Limnocylindrales bacterium]
RGLDRLVAEIADGVPVGGLRDVLVRSLGDPTLDLVFAVPSGGYVDAAGRPVTVPDRDPERAVTVVVRGGVVIAAIVHDPQLDADEPGLVARVGQVAGMALENERLAADVRAQLAEVRASRARIAEAGDAERRRIERDLHDGAQARLVALGMRLQVARATMPEAAGVLDDATLELETAIREIRGLAAGVHPTILTEAGLAAAIDDLAERAPVPVEVDAPRSRFPAPVETVAYFVVAEAVTNAVRHADANLVRVRVATGVDTLEIHVADDGRGGASPTGGSGLRGLADRLAAVGGTLSVESTAGAGTTVHAVVPIAPATLVPAAPEHAEGDGTRVGRPPEPGPVVADGPRGRRSIPPVAAATLAVGAAIGILAATAFLLDVPQRSPVDGRAEAFLRPFVFQTPAGSGIRLFDGPSDADPATRSAHLHVLTRSALADEGISVWAVEDVLEDPCRIDGPTVARDPGVPGLLAALGRVDRLGVRRVAAGSLDGRPSTVVDLRVIDAKTDCASGTLVLWRDPEPTSGAWIQVPEAETVRVVLVDVDGATIAFEIWSRGSLAEWLPTAEDIIESIRFLRSGDATGS